MFQLQDLTEEKHQGGGCCHFCHERVLGYEVYLHRRSSHDFIFSGKRMLHLADIQAVATGSGQVELQKITGQSGGQGTICYLQLADIGASNNSIRYEVSRSSILSMWRDLTVMSEIISHLSH